MAEGIGIVRGTLIPSVVVTERLAGRPRTGQTIETAVTRARWGVVGQ